MTASARAALGACRAGVQFLLSQQAPDGHWNDWQLPPGPSDQWTTAYVGNRLAVAPEPLASVSTEARLAAATWLVEHELPAGGWGYCDLVGADADSTAWSLLFLSPGPVRVNRSSCEFLAGFQRPDGGFSTYPSESGLGAWCKSHVDVTAIAARALFRRPVPEFGDVVERALDYLDRERRPDGIWESFWWDSPLYSTAAVLAVMRDTGRAVDTKRIAAALARTPADSAFEQALLLECFIQCGGFGRARVTAVQDAMIRGQLSDGSWPSVPILRLTDRGITDPAGRDDAGPLFADPNRLFTTATVLGALSGFLRVADLGHDSYGG